jgi:hypothetical protein
MSSGRSTRTVTCRTMPGQRGERGAREAWRRERACVAWLPATPGFESKNETVGACEHPGVNATHFLYVRVPLPTHFRQYPATVARLAHRKVSVEEHWDADLLPSILHRYTSACTCPDWDRSAAPPDTKRHRPASRVPSQTVSAVCAFALLTHSPHAPFVYI